MRFEDLKPGAYVLTETVTNPRPHARRNGWEFASEWEGGREFIVFARAGRLFIQPTNGFGEMLLAIEGQLYDNAEDARWVAMVTKVLPRLRQTKSEVGAVRAAVASFRERGTEDSLVDAVAGMLASGRVVLSNLAEGYAFSMAQKAKERAPVNETALAALEAARRAAAAGPPKKELVFNGGEDHSAFEPELANMATPFKDEDRSRSMELDETDYVPGPS